MHLPEPGRHTELHFRFLRWFWFMCWCVVIDAASVQTGLGRILPRGIGILSRSMVASVCARQNEYVIAAEHFLTEGDHVRHWRNETKKNVAGGSFRGVWRSKLVVECQVALYPGVFEAIDCAEMFP